MRRVIALLAVATTVGVSGCALAEDAAPRDIAPEQVEPQAIVTGDDATGVNRIYLIAPGDEQIRLRSVARDAATSPDALLRSLISGPNADELDRGISSAIPQDLRVLSSTRVGFVLTIDVNDALSTLASEGLTLALAQIVATVTELDPIQRVRIREEGENQAWPTADGRTSAAPLSIFDYPNFIETSQPGLPTLPST